MGTNNTPVVVSFSIVILLLLSLLLLLTYNSKCSVYLEPMENPQESKTPAAPRSVADIANASVNMNDMYSATGSTTPSNPSGASTFANLQTAGSPEAQKFSNQNKDKFSNSLKERFENAPYPAGMESPSMSELAQNVPGGAQACFPRDRLTAQDLLPKDAADSKWAQLNPAGTGDIHDQNYLTAGYHIGVNTVGQSMRNANLQLRSEIPNPQTPVGPWMISTIEPDLRQNTLEIGSSPSY